jgi:hypothetical protein
MLYPLESLMSVRDIIVIVISKVATMIIGSKDQKVA